MALSFPVYSCVYMDLRISWPVMPHGLTGGRRSVTCQALGALIPLDSAMNMEELIRAHAWFQYRLTMLINEKKFGKLTIAERKEETLKFIMVAMKSPYPMTTETKILFLRDRGIITDRDVFHKEVRRYSDKWSDNDFSFDPAAPRVVAPGGPSDEDDQPPGPGPSESQTTTGTTTPAPPTTSSPTTTQAPRPTNPPIPAKQQADERPINPSTSKSQFTADIAPKG